MNASLKKLFFLVLLFCPYFIYASTAVDSLQNILSTAQTDTSRLRSKYEFALGQKNFRLGFWDSINAEAVRLKMKDLEARSLDYLGTINRNIGNISKSSDYYIASLKIMQSLNDKRGIASGYNNLGIVYRTLRDTNKAIEYHFKALKLSQEINDKMEISTSFNSLAIIEKTRNNFDIAIAYYNKSLVLRKEMKYEFGIAEIYFNLGTLYKSKKNIDSAKVFFKRSWELFAKVKDDQGVSYSLNYLAGIYISEKNYAEAEQYAKIALEIGDRISLPRVTRNAAQSLFKIYRIKGKYKEALEMHLLFIKMRDSINDVESREASIKSTMKFEFDKRTTADSLRVAKEKEIVAVQLKQEATQRYALYGGLVLTLLFGGFIFNRFRVTQKQNKIIAEQKKLVEQKNKEVTDSIQYAKRIQQSLLPTEKYMDRNLKRLLKK